MVDMRHTAGLDVRPLRELTGESMFNEVFFDDVFVPDDCLVGAADDGWRAARTTLANERVFMGGGMTLRRAASSRSVHARRTRSDRRPPRRSTRSAGSWRPAHALACLGFR